MIDGGAAGTSPSVDEDADIGVKNAPEGLEEPAMGVDFLLVTLLKTEDHLHGDSVFACG